MSSRISVPNNRPAADIWRLVLGVAGALHLALGLASILPPRACAAELLEQPAGRSDNHDYDLEELAERQEWLRFRAAHALDGQSGLAAAPNENLFGDNESCIAINPTNPDNIAYASLQETRVSMDGGSTFAAAVPCLLPSTHYGVGDPSVSFDSQGRLFWSYLGQPVAGGNDVDIFVAQCNPSTGDILPGYPVNVTASHGGYCTDKQWLTTDSWPQSPHADRLYLAWTDLYSCSDVYSIVYVVYSTDHGATWSPIYGVYSASTYLWPVHIATAPNGDVYVSHPSGDAINLQRSTDGGATFAFVTDPFPSGSRSMPAISGVKFWLNGSRQPWVLADPLTPGKISVVSGYSRTYIAQSLDYGTSWSAPRAIDPSSGGLQCFATAACNRLNGDITAMWYDTRDAELNAGGNYLLDTYATVSTDGGTTFAPAFRINDAKFDPDLNAPCRVSCPPPLFSVWASGPSNAYICGDANYQWDGSAWAGLALPGSSSNRSVWGASASAVWIVGLSGEIEFFNGTTWAVQSSGVSASLWGVYGSDADDVYCVGDGGTILHWNGAVWSIEASGTTAALRGVWTSPTGVAWAVGIGGLVLRRTGGVWNPGPPIGTDEWLRGIWGSSDSDVWVAGLNGNVYHWNGVAWSTMTTGVELLRGVWGSSSSDVYFLGRRNYFVHWNGSQLETLPGLGGGFHIYGVGGSGPGDVYAVGATGAAWHYDGVTWSKPALGFGSPSVTRIGEYIGVGLVASGGVATWTGNSSNPNSSPATQATVFGRFNSPTTSVESLRASASLVLLEPGKPNPFRWVTSVEYSLAKPQAVNLSVYDVRGRFVRVLDSGPREAGRHQVTWDGRDVTGTNASAGVYILKLQNGLQRSAQKIVLTR